MAVLSQGQSPVFAGLGLRPKRCTRAESVTQSAASAAVRGLWRYIGLSDRFKPPSPTCRVQYLQSETGRLKMREQIAGVENARVEHAGV